VKIGSPVVYFHPIGLSGEILVHSIYIANIFTRMGGRGNIYDYILDVCGGIGASDTLHK
jgi:hypothetical protein